jgi:hypothetical protein
VPAAAAAVAAGAACAAQVVGTGSGPVVSESQAVEDILTQQE